MHVQHAVFRVFCVFRGKALFFLHGRARSPHRAVRSRQGRARSPCGPSPPAKVGRVCLSPPPLPQRLEGTSLIATIAPFAKEGVICVNCRALTRGKPSGLQLVLGLNAQQIHDLFYAWLICHHFLDDVPLTLRVDRPTQCDFAAADTDLDSLRRYCCEIPDCLQRSLCNAVVGRRLACGAHGARMNSKRFLCADFRRGSGTTNPRALFVRG